MKIKVKKSLSNLYGIFIYLTYFQNNKMLRSITSNSLEYLTSKNILVWLQTQYWH